MSIFLLAFIASFGINIVMFIPAFIFKTDKLTDLSYALTFIFVASAGYLQSDGGTVQLIITCAVILWALRLGSFLFIRIRKMNKDKRFDGMRENFFKFLRFWLLQALAVWVVTLSLTSTLASQSTGTNVYVFVGLAVFMIGLFIEAIADSQKYVFAQSPANKDRWIQSGLWSISRHPNYLGEILVWVGVCVMSQAVLVGSYRLYALASPLFITLLLIFVSGIPLLEKAADNKWGNDPKYQAYKKKTAVLIPHIW